MNTNFSILQAVYYKDNPIFLEECLSSIYLSTLLPERIILVKDGSLSDSLEDVINRWAEKLPLLVVGYEKNSGLAHALNYGLQFIDTDYVARMDSDDVCCPERFEKQMTYMESHSDISVCGTGLIEFYIENGGQRREKIRLYPEEVSKNSKCLFRGTPLGHPTVMIKTSLLKSFRYSEETKMNEDIELWFRLIRNGYEIYNIQEPLLNFRITDGTFKRRSLKKAFDEFKIYYGNLRKLHKVDFGFLFIYVRLLSRLLPYKFTKRLYFSKLRSKMLMG